MVSSGRIRVPLGIFPVAMGQFLFPGTSCEAYMKLLIVLCMFTPPFRSDIQSRRPVAASIKLWFGK